MSGELKPCPLCGGKAKLYHDVVGTQDQYNIQCTECKTCYGGIDLKETIETWNTRSRDRFEALRTCPLCGEPAEFWEEDGGWYVRCTCDGDGCGFYTPTFETREEAAALWNGTKSVINNQGGNK